MALLLDAGQSIRVLERPEACIDHLPLDQIELVNAAIRDEPAVRKAALDCKYVYHITAHRAQAQNNTQGVPHVFK